MNKAGNSIYIQDVPGWGLANRNFAGDPKKDKFGSDEKKFSLCLTDDFSDVIETMRSSGLRVNPWFSEEHNTMNYYVRVRVGKGLKVYVKPANGGDPFELSPESFDSIDSMPIDKATMFLFASPWEKNNRTGVTAWVNELWINEGTTRRDDAYEAWRSN